MLQITTILAGVSFGDAPKNIAKFGYVDIGTLALIREPDNPHDPNAVRVSLFDIYNMGYLKREVAEKVAPLMDEITDRQFKAEIKKMVEKLCDDAWEPELKLRT